MSGKDLTPTVVALGYFDSVHIGHRKVLERAKTLAAELGATVTAFTFDGNLRAALSLKGDKFVYNLKERTEIFNELGIFDLFVQRVDFNFLSIAKLAFLNRLNKKMNIKAYVCGEDYKFGKFAKGTTEDLIKYANANGQRVEIVETLTDGGKKISSSRIKSLLAAGEIEAANKLLARPYSFRGTVVKDRGVGATLGFPTANLKVEKNKQPLKEGVYGGHLFIDGKEYKAVINFGRRPTFDNNDFMIEAHVLDYSGDLYDKTITLFFDFFIRETRKFLSAEELQKQISFDAEKVKNGGAG